MRFDPRKKPSVLENPLRCFGKSVTCKPSVLKYTLYINPRKKPSVLDLRVCEKLSFLPISKTFRFRFEGMSKTVLFSSVCRRSLHLHSVECKENSKALKKGTF
nr:MAG TPA: hypothetical protein [Caudoviricetes sp.]